MPHAAGSGVGGEALGSGQWAVGVDRARGSWVMDGVSVGYVCTSLIHDRLESWKERAGTADLSAAVEVVGWGLGVGLRGL